MNDRTGDVIEITIKDSTMKKLGTWKFNAADKELANGIFRHIFRKYEFSIEKRQEKTNKVEKDFLDMSVDW